METTMNLFKVLSVVIAVIAVLAAPSLISDAHAVGKVSGTQQLIK